MSMKDLQYFKDALKAILDKQGREERVINKAFTLVEAIQKSRHHALYAIGDRATWGGKVYIKGFDKKWRRYFEKETRGAKVATNNIKKEIDNATTGERLMRIVLKHRGRFSDKWGAPLPIVEELRAYIDNRQGDFGAGKKHSAHKWVSKVS